jgi:hypothetical protein
MLVNNLLNVDNLSSRLWQSALLDKCLREISVIWREVEFDIFRVL